MPCLALKCMFLDCGRKPGYPARTYSCMGGEHTDFTKKDLDLNLEPSCCATPTRPPCWNWFITLSFCCVPNSVRARMNFKPDIPSQKVLFVFCTEVSYFLEPKEVTFRHGKISLCKKTINCTTELTSNVIQFWFLFPYHN